MARRNVQTRLAVLHHHGDDLVEMEETYRERDEVPLDETAIVIYLCPRCETINRGAACAVTNNSAHGR